VNLILTMMACGALGVLARYEVQILFAQKSPEFAHIGTLLVNVGGSFAMGIVYILSLEKAQITDEMRIALMVGFLGGFTTFSSYALESIRLMETGNMLRTVFYVALSPALSIVFCALGIALARKFG
jgi:CrcB protein